MPKFAANLSMLYPEKPFLERFECAAKDGFKAVEFLFPYAFEATEIASRLQLNGLKQVLLNAPPGGVDAISIDRSWLNGDKGTACIPGREREFRDGVALALRYASALSCPYVHVLAGRLPIDVSREDAQRTYVDNLRWAAREAATCGIVLLIEPINTRDMPQYFLNRQADAHAIVQTVGAANLKVQMDLYHCQIVEGDVAMKLREYLPTGRVGHIQIAGVPERHEPDVGELNYSYIFELIDDLGYGGWVGCEYRPQRGATAGGTSAGLDWFQRLR
jgi:hydroxypyruvate isomerase